MKERLQYCEIFKEHLFWKTSVNSCFWKSALQWQIHRMEVIPDFLYHFKPFSTLNFAMTECFFSCNMFSQGFSVIVFFLSQTWYFYHKKLFYKTHHMRYYNFSIAEIFVESVNLIQMPKQKIISPWWRTIRFL